MCAWRCFVTYGVIGMLDLIRDPSAGTRDAVVVVVAPSPPECPSRGRGLVALPSLELFVLVVVSRTRRRNCSLFILVAVLVLRPLAGFVGLEKIG